MTDLSAMLARLTALRRARKLAAWERGKPRQRAADRKRRLARAEAAYLAMPKLRPDALAACAKPESGRRPPNPPGEILGNRQRFAPPGRSVASWDDPSPPSRHPNRRPFDTLFADPRRFRGDLRLARTAIRRNTVPPENRGPLIDKLMALLDVREEYERLYGPCKAGRLMLGAARALLDAAQHNLRLDWELDRLLRGYGKRGPIPRRAGVREGCRLDVRALQIGDTGPSPVATGFVRSTFADGTQETATIVRLPGVREQRWAYLCPRCRRRCRYLFARMSGLACRRCARRTYRKSR